MKFYIYLLKYVIHVSFSYQIVSYMRVGPCLIIVFPRVWKRVRT